MERILIILLGIALVLVSLESRETEQRLDGERMFWRAAYRAAEKDARYKNCLELDEHHAVCERPE